MKKILKFLESLAANNNREWFNSHKEEYLEVKNDIEVLTQKLINEVAAFDPDAAYLGVGECTYRIYRDTRFSIDKTPYKTHIGIFINPPMGKKSNRMGYYLHIEPGNCMVAVGTVCLPSKTVTAIRQSIYDNVEEYLDIINEKEFHDSFPEIGENPVKTAPKGIPRDWEYVALVRPRDFVASHPLSDKEMCKDDLVGRAGRLFRLGKPFNDFINYTIDECSE
jgi:TIGR02453 family protein